MAQLGEADYKAMIEGRLDTMWARYRDCDRQALLEPMRRNQAAGRYLVAGDLAALRAELQPGQTVRDLGRPALRRVLTERFEYVAAQQAM